MSVNGNSIHKIPEIEVFLEVFQKNMRNLKNVSFCLI